MTAVPSKPSNGLILVTVSDDTTARLWDVTTHETVGTLRGHIGSIFGVAFNVDGHTVATIGDDHITKLWDTDGPILIPSPLAAGHDVHNVEFSPDRSMLAIASAEVVLLRNMDNLYQITLPAGLINAMAFNRNGHILATAGADGVQLWDTAGHRPATTLPSDSGPIGKVVFSPNNNILVTASADGTVLLWNVADPAHPAPLDPPLTSHINQMAFSPDNRILVTVVDDGTMRGWDADTGEFIMSFPISNRLPGERLDPVALSADGRTLATVSGDDATANLWEVDDNDQLKFFAALTGHVGPIKTAAFSADGDFLITASDDGTVRLWNLDTKQVTTDLCNIIGAVSREQWARFVPSAISYDPICS